MIGDNWKDPWGDRRQELVFIGADLDREQIVAELDACLLTDDELAGGFARWASLADPWPAWTPGDDRRDAA